MRRLFTPGHARGVLAVVSLLWVAAACGSGLSSTGDRAGQTTTSRLPGSSADTDSEPVTDPQPRSPGLTPGRILLDDDFESNENDWINSIPEGFRDVVTVDDGKLRFTTRPGQARLTNTKPINTANELVTGDQRVEATATLDVDGVAAIGCRGAATSTDARHIKFLVSSTGEASLYQVPKSALVSKDETAISSFVTMDSVPPGSVKVAPDTPHELALECTGDGQSEPVAVSGFVDGEEVVSGEAFDHVPTGSLSVGFFHPEFGNLPPGQPPISVSYDRVRFVDLAQEPTADFRGPTVVDESFADDSLLWAEDVLKSSIRSVEVADGALTFDVGPDGGSAIAAPNVRPVDDVIGDQRVEVRATMEPAASLQLLCRVEETGFRDTRFGVDSHRSPHLVRAPGEGEAGSGELVDLEDIVNTPFDALTDEPFDLAMECLDADEGMVVIGYVNGQEVIRGTDPDPGDNGFAGVAVGYLDAVPGPVSGDGYKVRVDEFRLIDLSD